MSHFSSIGLAADGQDGFVRLIDQVMEGAVDDAPATPPARHVRWTDASGASVAIHADAPPEIACVTPYFVSPSPTRWRVRTHAAALDPECAHCGGADCDVLDDAGELVTRTTAQWLHFVPYRTWLADGTRDFPLEVVAFAHQASFFATEQAFSDGQAAWFGDEPMAATGKPMRLATESFMPTGMFAEAGATVGERAVVLFAGRVESVARPVNALTSRSFLHARVATLPGALDVVADPAVLEGTPAVGALALVSGWLVGRPTVAPPTPPPRTGGWMRRLFSGR